jgi:hypothetical protein
MTRLHLVLLGSVLLLACSEKPGPSVVEPPPEEGCETSDDCSGGRECIDGACEAPTCTDGIQNQDETDVDCGGMTCGPCAAGKSCRLEFDCIFSCVDGVCQQSGSGGPDGGPPDEDMGADSDTGSSPGTCEDTGEPRRFVRWKESGLDLAAAGDTGTDFTAGIGIADFDGDGNVDVVTTSPVGNPKLLLNQGDGTFADATAQSGLGDLNNATAIAIADFDGDSDSDLFLGRSEGQYLLENDGAATFTDVTDAWGLGGWDSIVSAASFVDFDGDGDLDLYVSGWSMREGVATFVSVPNVLYRNDGDGFTALSSSPGGEATMGKTNAATWWDYDEDGDPDLLVGNDFGPVDVGDQLWRNVGPDSDDPDGWLFTDVSAQANFDTKLFTMSTTVADFDNDLDLDVYLANFGFNVLHVVEDGVATDEAVDRGVGVGHLADPIPMPTEDPSFGVPIDGMEEFVEDYTDPSLDQYVLTSWASIFFDANHDGWQDLWVVNGMVVSEYVPEATNQPNYLLHSLQDGTFERAPCWYRPDIRGSSRGSAVGDLDGDGDLDILFTDTGLNTSDPGLYALRNDDGDGNWLIVELQGTAPNTDAIGARVVIDVGGARQMRHIDGGQGFVSVSERIAHFGVADADTIDSIEVTWPDGTTTTQTDVDANRRLVIIQ